MKSDKSKLEQEAQSSPRMIVNEREEVLAWAQGLDKYLGNVTDYNAFKGEVFEEIDLADYSLGGRWPKKWVRVENEPDLGMLTRL